MPHQCTNCGHEFADGSQEMLSGCPECGGNKFQFKPARETGLRQDTEPDPDSADSEDRDREYGEWPETAKRPAEKEESTAEPATDESSADATTASTQSDGVAPGSPTGAPTEWPSPASGGSTEADESESAPSATNDTPEPSESSAESTRDATTEPEKPAETAEAYEENEAQASARTEMVSTDELPEQERSDRPADPTADPSATDFERLREELNDQFESIRVVSPGTYELNLMELYDRQEYIISLREDGRYVIEMPGSWDSPDSE